MWHVPLSITRKLTYRDVKRLLPLPWLGLSSWMIIASQAQYGATEREYAQFQLRVLHHSFFVGHGVGMKAHFPAS
jgi:hypothetical protein